LPKFCLVEYNPDVTSIIQENLEQTEVTMVILNYQNLAIPLDSEGIDLHLFDCSFTDLHDFYDYSKIFNSVAQLNLPAVFLIPQNNLEMVIKLILLGFYKFIFLPVGKMDFQKQIYQALKQNQPDSQMVLDSKDLAYLLKLLSDLKHIHLGKRSIPFVYNCLMFLQKALKSEKVFFFQEIGKEFFELKYAIPSYLLDNPLRISVNHLKYFRKTVDLKEVLCTTDILPNGDENIFLKSYFNMDSGTIISFPVRLNDSKRGLCLIIWSNLLNLENIKIGLIEFAQQLIEMAYIKSFSKPHAKEKPEKNKNELYFEYLNQIFNQLNFGIMIIDNQNRIKYLNRYATDLLSVKIKDHQKLLVNDILGTENTRKILDRLNTVLPGASERPEIDIFTRDGEKLHIGFNVSRLKIDFNLDSDFIVALTDLTYTTEIQEELRRMDKLASLGILAGGIAHEIRNPLAGIKAIAQTFEEELDPDDPKNEYVKRIIRQVNRMDDMLRTLFVYAKPQKPDRQFISIKKIIQEVISLLKQKLNQHDVTLHQTYSPALPEIFVDHVQIQQVILNLILNSIEAIDKSGQIFISCKEMPKSLKMFQRKPFYQQITEKPYLMMHIMDTGEGMSEDIKEKIFNPFFTTKSFGTGLGLSIVYQVVKENNGVVYFESEPNTGTNCYLFLPTRDLHQLSESDKPK
jgi:nitrogen-specific signal transduction histidine kinase